MSHYDFNEPTETDPDKIFHFDQLDENTEWKLLTRKNYNGQLYQPPYRRRASNGEFTGRIPSRRPPRSFEEYEKLKKRMERMKKQELEKKRLAEMIPMSQEPLDLIERPKKGRIVRRKKNNKNKKKKKK